MDGESYHTLNPFALDLLAYSEVYALTKSLNIGESTPRRGRVSKEVLIERIIEFHRGRNEEGHTLIDSEYASDSQENLPMNVTGNNFAVLQVIPDVTDRRKSKYPRSGQEEHDRPSAVIKADATYLRALQGVNMSICADTPSKSILKKCDSPTSVQREYDCERMSLSVGRIANPDFSNSKSKVPTPGKLDKITFSPFNAVKVIPHRKHMNDPCKQLSFGFGDDGAIPEEEECDTDTSAMEEWEEEEDEEFDTYPEDEIYSDDETNELVLANTARNSNTCVVDANAMVAEEGMLCDRLTCAYGGSARMQGSGSPTLNSHEFFEL
jgi:hypothetical protein